MAPLQEISTTASSDSLNHYWENPTKGLLHFIIMSVSGLKSCTDTKLQTIAIPTWSGYQSTINSVMPVVRIGTPPLLAAPAHEWSTLLTSIMQAQGINAKVMGPSRKTVVTLDRGFYKPAKQLQMARQDMGNLILRPGE